MEQEKPRLVVLIASTRPGRQGPVVARWAFDAIQRHGGFRAELVDLAEVGLPIFDEPHHPRQQKYQHEHTKRWSAIVGAADAFVFVTPEYNFGPPPSLLNALNFLYNEWNYKPVAFVSYAGVSAGTRGVQVTKNTVTTLKMVPVYEAVSIPNFWEHIADGRFQAKDVHEKAAKDMLDELARWAAALKPMRSRA